MHVGAHQSAVGVVVLQERHERSGNRNQLLGAHVDIINFFPRNQHEVAGLARIDEFGNDAALVIELDVRLCDYVAIFLPCGKVERKWFCIDVLLAALFQVRIDLVGLFRLDVVAYAIVAVAGVDHGHKVDHPAILDAPIRRLNKAIIVDASVTTQRADQADVGTFRGLDRADAAIVRWVNVAHFKSSTLSRESAWSKGREAAFVRDLGERVGLVHELRELR